VGAPKGCTLSFSEDNDRHRIHLLYKNVCRKVFGGFGHRNCIFVHMPISVKQGDRLASKMGIRV